MPVDPGFSEYLSDPRNTVHPPPSHIPIEKVRQAADNAMVQGLWPVMASVRNVDVALEGRVIPVRHYRPGEAENLPAILFCHGGGFVGAASRPMMGCADGLRPRPAPPCSASVIAWHRKPHFRDRWRMSLGCWRL